MSAVRQRCDAEWYRRNRAYALRRSAERAEQIRAITPASRRGSWSADEDALVLGDLPLIEVAHLVDRSYDQVCSRREKLLHPDRVRARNKQAMRKHRERQGHSPEWRGSRPDTCSVDGCDRPHVARGWCGTHHKRWLVNGTVEIVRSPRGACTEPGCGRPTKGRGLCNMHYQRWFRQNRTSA